MLQRLPTRTSLSLSTHVAFYGLENRVRFSVDVRPRIGGVGVVRGTVAVRTGGITLCTIRLFRGGEAARLGGVHCGRSVGHTTSRPSMGGVVPLAARGQMSQRLKVILIVSWVRPAGLPVVLRERKPK